MGKQTRFYMLPEDEKFFFAYVVKDENTHVILEHPKERQVEIVDKSMLLNQGSVTRDWYLIWNSKIPIDPEDIGIAHPQKYDDEKMNFVPTGEIRYYIAKLDAPVIEYSPSILKPDGEISQGRIWADVNFVKDNAWVNKGEEFNSFYEKIAHWLRRNLSSIKDIDGYFGPEIIKYHKEGKVMINHYGCWMLQSES